MDISDLAVFGRYIGDANIVGFNETAADVDSDGEVEVADVFALARIIAVGML